MKQKTLHEILTSLYSRESDDFISEIETVKQSDYIGECKLEAMISYCRTLSAYEKKPLKCCVCMLLLQYFLIVCK